MGFKGFSATVSQAEIRTRSKLTSTLLVVLSNSSSLVSLSNQPKASILHLFGSLKRTSRCSRLMLTKRPILVSFIMPQPPHIKLYYNFQLLSWI
ncbi:hypothetical protein CPB83DRAFT_266814 [Crepidotus variabilis]|uniref:Uncharacterized protein n=1 Tax=Crepidotus variabilis TaxID=179855 RepID=A0A9P6EI91_9AGAR|nr:hypothetical protein CPB83DRAFT_266814 [Crepidotus variabilis]